MKTRVPRSILILGILGLIAWVSVVLLRRYFHTENALYHTITGFLPNIAAAWFVVAVLQFIYTYPLDRVYRLKTHAFFCLAVMTIALCSEVLFTILGRHFDWLDLLATVVALLIMLGIPWLQRNNT